MSTKKFTNIDAANALLDLREVLTVNSSGDKNVVKNIPSNSTVEPQLTRKA